jgi:MYXO-CTERM domain-containing protein
VGRRAGAEAHRGAQVAVVGGQGPVAVGVGGAPVALAEDPGQVHRQPQPRGRVLGVNGGLERHVGDRAVLGDGEGDGDDDDAADDDDAVGDDDDDDDDDAGECPQVVDADTDALGNAISAGDDISAAYAAWGINFAAYTDPAMAIPLAPVVYDSENPPAGFEELGTPNEDFGGAGIGDGGGAGEAGENAEGLGNAVQTSAGNTWYIVEFDEATCVHSVDVIDIDTNELDAQVILFDVNIQTVDTITASGLGDNSVETLDLGGTCGIHVMMIDFYGQAGWDNLTVCVDPDGEEEVCDDGVDNDGDGEVDEDCADDGDDGGAPVEDLDDLVEDLDEWEEDDGVGCSVTARPGAGLMGLLLAFGLVAVRRRT